MARPRPQTGFLAPIALAAGIGLLICSLANALSREGGDPMLLYWAGVLLISLPTFWRLTSRDATRGERLGLVVLLGLSLYGVKVVRDAPLFTFSDEMVHAFNADQIVRHGELFRANPILAVTPSFPGLEGATSALMELTGMSSYWAGVVVVGAARLAMMIGLFVLFARVSGSNRTAGLGAAIYAANFNFLFWGAQFSYESLALPLLIVVIAAVAERDASPREWARDWALPLVLGIASIVVIHHLTSYATAVFLIALAGVYWVLRRDWSWPNPWRYGVLATLLALAWLFLVANSTFGYLGPVLGSAFESVFHTASGEAPPRALFQGKGSSVPTTPILARGVALLAVLILAGAAALGLKKAWDRYRRDPFVLIFAAASAGFFATLLLRLAPAAWETGNRLSEYFFVGLAFIAALAAAWERRPEGLRRLDRAALTAAFGVLIVGGAIAGWPWDLQLASPLRVSAEGRTISSPPLALAEWARREIPEGDRFAATIADARLLLTPGEHVALAGKTPDIEDILEETGISGWEAPLLREEDVRYIVADRRQIASDATRGYYFSTASEEEEALPVQVVSKFNQMPGAKRIYSGGDISVYELGKPE